MEFIDCVGYLASALVLLTFSMRTMLRLRAVAISSNIAFAAYGFGAGIYPVLLLHLALLPVNIWLLLRMTTLLRKANRAAATDLSPAWLQPFMHTMQVAAGAAIFRKGDHADALYMIASGAIRLPEIDHLLAAGDLFGEIGLFSVERRRTQSAIAETDAELLWISGSEVQKLCERNPGLSLYFLRLIATRMTANAARVEQVSRRASGRAEAAVAGPA